MRSMTCNSASRLCGGQTVAVFHVCGSPGSDAPSGMLAGASPARPLDASYLLPRLFGANPAPRRRSPDRLQRPLSDPAAKSVLDTARQRPVWAQLSPGAANLTARQALPRRWSRCGSPYRGMLFPLEYIGPARLDTSTVAPYHEISVLRFSAGNVFMGISLAVGRLTLDQVAEVRILHPQPTALAGPRQLPPDHLRAACQPPSASAPIAMLASNCHGRHNFSRRGVPRDVSR